jgi:ribosomal protein S18 acetylase RimI-like enzyme
MTPTGTDYVIRSAQVDEAEAIAESDVACWREAYRDILPPPMLARLSVARRAAQWRRVLVRSESTGIDELYIAVGADGAIAGHGSFGSQRLKSLAQGGYGGEIYALYVLKSAQRRGIGTSLMRRMMDAMAARGVAKCGLWVLQENTAARAFYRKLGGQELGRRKELWQGLLVVPEIAYGWTLSHQQ